MKYAKLIVNTLVGAGISLSLVLPAQAASVCKGLEQNLCGENSQCRWIVGYKRSDGRDVRGYCRVMPATKSVQKESNTKSSG